LETAENLLGGHSHVWLNASNGLAEGMRGRAKTTQLRSLVSNDVPIIIQGDSKGLYGGDIDGLRLT
jgi:hypothetical protein